MITATYIFYFVRKKYVLLLLKDILVKYKIINMKQWNANRKFENKLMSCLFYFF